MSVLCKQNVDVAFLDRKSIPSAFYDIILATERSMGHLQINMSSSLPSSVIADTCQDTREIH